MQNLMNLTNAMKSMKVSSSQNNSQQENLQKNVKIQKNVKKSFIHAHDIVFINSTEHKGKLGFINDFTSGKYQVTIKEYFYKNLINVNIGSKIPTQNGLATVEHIKPEIYQIDNVIVTSFDKYVVYRNNENDENDDTYTLARVVSFEGPNFVVYNTDISWKGQKGQDDTLEYIKSKNLNFDNVDNLDNSTIFNWDLRNINIDQIIYTFYSSKTENGIVFGKLNISSQNVKLYLLKNILLTHKQIEKIDKTHLKITKGPFASDIIYPFIFMEPHLSITLHSTGQKIFHHNVKYQNKIINRPIYPKDVFYMDLKLKNGNYAEVIGIDSYNNISIKEITKDRSLINNIITFNDISLYLPGFKWTDTEIDQELQIDNVDDNLDDTITDKIDSIDNNSDNESEYDSEHVMENTFVPESSEQEIKGSYKDNERTTFIQEELTDIQKKFKKIINDILSQFNLQLDSIDWLNTIHNIEFCLTEIDKMSLQENIEQNIYFSGYRFILSSILFNKIKNLNNNVNLFNYTKTILPVLFGKSSKTQKIISDNEHIFTLYTNLNYFGHLKSIKQIKTWINNKKTDHMSIINEMMSIAYQLAKKILNLTKNTTQQIFKPEFIPLGKGTYVNNNYIHYNKDNDLSLKKFITLNEIINNGLPTKEYKIIYNPEIFNDIFHKVNVNISNQLESLDKNSNDYVSLQFIKRNLLRIPYALREITKDSSDYNNLKIVYDQLISALDNFNKSKTEKIEQNLLKKNKINDNRKHIISYSTIDNIREKYTSIEYPENLPLDKLKKFCEQLELKKSGTKEELIHRIELKLKLIDPVFTQTQLLSKSYKGNNSWTLHELETIAEDLDIGFLQDSSKEDLYNLINNHFIDQEKLLFTITGETNVYTPDQIIDDSQLRKLQIHGKNFQGNNFTVIFKASKKAINDWITHNKLTITNLSEVLSSKRTFDVSESESESESESIDSELTEAINLLKKQKL